MAPTGDEIVAKFASAVPGKTVLITGPSESGIGAETAISLAVGKPKLILLAGRDRSKIQPVINHIAKAHPDVPVSFVSLDLTSQLSIRETAKQVNSQIESLDLLINNAGIMATKDYTLTADGIELQFGVNHIGHFLLTNLLMKRMLASKSGARIINISSFGYIMSGIRDDWNFKKEPYNAWRGYGQSKTANILFSSALARKLKRKGVLAFSVNPGFIPATSLQASAEVTQERFAEGYAITLEALKGAPMVPLIPKTLAEGSATALYAALSPALSDNSGAILSDCDVYPDLLPHAVGQENETRLWILSEEIVGENFSY